MKKREDNLRTSIVGLCRSVRQCECKQYVRTEPTSPPRCSKRVVAPSANESAQTRPSIRLRTYPCACLDAPALAMQKRGGQMYEKTSIWNAIFIRWFLSSEELGGRFWVGTNNAAIMLAEDTFSLKPNCSDRTWHGYTFWESLLKNHTKFEITKKTACVRVANG